MRFAPDSHVAMTSTNAHNLHRNLLFASKSEENTSIPTLAIDLEIPNFQNDLASSPQDVFLCVDVSGSMGGVLVDVRRVVGLVARQLRRVDRLAVIKFESTAAVVVPLAPIDDISQFDVTIDHGLVGGGGTDIGAGVELCLDELARAGDDVESSLGRISSLIVLSDGQTSGLMRDGIVALCRERLERSRRHLIVNSLGFTTACDVPLMQGITVAGNAGDGLFYFLRSADPADIGSAIGDCLGSTSSVVLTDLQLELVPSNGRSRFRFFRGEAGGSSSAVARLGAMSATQRHTFVITRDDDDDDEPMPAVLDVQVSYTPAGSRHVVTHRLAVPLTVSDDPSLMQASEAHCVVHVLRERTAALLQRLFTAHNSQQTDVQVVAQVVEEIADLHETIIEKLQALQASELSAFFARMDEPKKAKAKASVDTNDEAVSLAALAAATAMHDEAVLEALSVDVGQVLFEQATARQRVGRPRYHHNGSSAFEGNVLRAMHEHMHQRSSHCSSGAVRAGVYTTSAQLAMRMRFVEGDSEATVAAKAAVPLESVELYGDASADAAAAEALTLRRAVDEEVQCFVSLENWREAHLGLALVVQPRTGRERRRGLLPRALLSGDVISSTTYNEGVRTLVQAAAPVQLDRDDVDNAEQHSVVVSSCRGRINAWLPLYINAEHWQHVRRFAKASVSIIGTQFNDQFSPALCLGVLSKLLIQTVVRFTVENDVSERTLQQFCDIHRVFLQLADDHPEVREFARARLVRFIEEPAARMRSETSDLGDLIQYLCVVEDQQWAGALSEAFVIESVRRAALQMGTDAHKQLHRLGGDVEQLLQFWAQKTSGGKVTTFCVAFLDQLARPAGTTLDALKRDIDRRWGHVRPAALAQLRDVCASIARNDRSVPEIMSNLVGRVVSPGAAAELILWGFREAFADEEHRCADYIALPADEGELVAEWREHCQIWTAALETPAADIEPFQCVVDADNGGERTLRRKRSLAGVGRALKRETKQRRRTEQQAPACVGVVHAAERHIQACDCKRCKYQVRVAQQLARWNGAPRERDTDDGTMFIGGLTPTMKESALLDLLVQHGRVRVLAIEIVHDLKGAQKPYAFATYDSNEAMMLAMNKLRTAWMDGRVGECSPECNSTAGSTIRNPFPALADDDASDRRRNRGQFWLDNKAAVFDKVRRVQPRWLARAMPTDDDDDDSGTR